MLYIDLAQVVHEAVTLSLTFTTCQSTNPEAIGPGTYRSKKRAIQVKKSQVPTPSYLSKAARFEDAKAQVSAVLSGMASVREGSQQLRSPTSNDGHGNNAVFVRIQRPDCTRGPLLSTTPRFKSQFFPGTVPLCG